MMQWNILRSYPYVATSADLAGYLGSSASLGNLVSLTIPRLLPSRGYFYSPSSQHVLLAHESLVLQVWT